MFLSSNSISFSASLIGRLYSITLDDCLNSIVNFLRIVSLSSSIRNSLIPSNTLFGNCLIEYLSSSSKLYSLHKESTCSFGSLRLF